VVVEVFATPQAATAAIGPALDEVEPGAFKAARKRRAAREAEEKAEQERIEREAREARERAEALERARQERAAANAADLERLRSQGFTEDSIAAFEQMQKIAAARRETASNNNTKEN
jgi:5'-deoxynucleotidase YfbR-like HD superfamily hydrolase